MDIDLVVGLFYQCIIKPHVLSPKDFTLNWPTRLECIMHFTLQPFLSCNMQEVNGIWTEEVLDTEVKVIYLLEMTWIAPTFLSNGLTWFHNRIHGYINEKVCTKKKLIA